MRHIYSAVKSIQRALKRVENDRFTPAVSSPRIPDYLVDLTVKHADDGSEFSKFVLSLEYDAIANELLRLLLPDTIRQPVLDCRVEYDELQSRKESEIADSNFDNAREFRDRQEQLAISIRELTAEQEFLVTPQLIDSVLKSLGYNDS